MPEPVITRTYGQLPVEIYADNESLGQAAAARAVSILTSVLEKEPAAHMIVATGNSQLTFYHNLVSSPGVDWSRVTIFHMDEYVGMRPDHPASFRRFLHEKLVDRVHPASFYGVEGDAVDPFAECERYAGLLREFPAHLVCLGIGENGHIAFNDPPFADFQDPKWVKVVQLDQRSRRQQVGEGHFARLEDVPTQAITLTIPALLAARQMLVIVPERRKNEAVQKTLNGPVTTGCPASILRTAPHARLYLDSESASLVI